MEQPKATTLMTTARQPAPEELAQAALGARPARRPFGLYAILVLLSLQMLAGALVLGLVLFNADNTPEALLAEVGTKPWDVPVLAGEVLFVLVTVVGLWLYKRWAWPLIMLILAYWLATDAYDYFFAQPRYLSMLLDVAIFFYLNQREVRGLFDPTARTLVRRETVDSSLTIT
jgi:hypothetical protein